MTYEVVVVGGGIGGLTVAALLAARGVSVCLFEREVATGGCVANFPIGAYEFEGGAGLYSSWGPGELHERIFAELKVSPPEVRLCAPAYVVRLPGGTDVAIGTDANEFDDSLAAAFPECAPEAQNFYRRLTEADSAIRTAAERWPDVRGVLGLSRLRSLSDARARNLLHFKDDSLAQHLGATSARFRRFIDSQLEMFGQCTTAECNYLYAAISLMLPRHGMYSIKGGGSALAECLTKSIKQNGGTVRVNTPVLRLAYKSDGHPSGVDLLSGETVPATRAIISNLTAWDTYGKLVGTARIPPNVRAQLRALHSRGAYMIYLGMDEAAARRLPAEHLLVADGPEDGPPDDRPTFMLAVTPAWDARGPEGKRAVTVWTQTATEEWFTYHEDPEQMEEQDQRTLESWWAKIHQRLPELGDGVEVIETETPQGNYERTRRRLGMVGGVRQSFAVNNPFGHRTPIPGLFMVGDTVFPGQGTAAVTHGAFGLADELTQ